ncbi:hypothetical protein [Kitasatospora sp. NPDC087315]|uniref:hypothetical protein n=1 Tax=Kitasatospora sp. NPDC087315 TaxID=3364069 RepID=UPI00382B1E10
MREFMTAARRWGRAGEPDEDWVRPHVLWLPQDQPQVLAYFARLGEITSRYPGVIAPIASDDLHMTIQKIEPTVADGSRVAGSMLKTAAVTVQNELAELEPFTIEIGPARPRITADLPAHLHEPAMLTAALFATHQRTSGSALRYGHTPLPRLARAIGSGRAYAPARRTRHRLTRLMSRTTRGKWGKVRAPGDVAAPLLSLERAGSHPGDVAAWTADGHTPPAGRQLPSADRAPAVIEYGGVVRVPRTGTAAHESRRP